MLYFFISGCLPPANENGSGEGALAGQAIALGCQTTTVRSCTYIRSSNSFSVTPLRGASVTYPLSICSGNVSINYNCATGSQLVTCKNRCEGSEQCVAGQCTPLPSQPSGLQCGGWTSYCDELLVGESKDYTIGSTNYHIALAAMVNDASGVHATFDVTSGGAGDRYHLLSGETVNFWAALGGSLSVTNILYQDYAGGVHSASFCLKP